MAAGQEWHGLVRSFKGDTENSGGYWCVESLKEEEEDFRIDIEVRCEEAHPLSGALSRRGLTQLS